MRFLTRITVAISAVAVFPMAIAAGCGDSSTNGTTTASSSSSGAAGEGSSSGTAGNGASSSSGNANGGAGGSGASGSGGNAGTGNGGMTGSGGAGMGGTGTGGNGTGGNGTGGATTGGAGGTGGGSGSSSSSSSSGMITDGGTDGGMIVIMPVKCLNQTYQCGDAIDNDMDGLTDWQDPDCLGPCDNTENSYYGGIPGQSGPACDVDCYWDSNSGSGDDNCFWNHKCDPLEATMPGSPEPYNKCKYDPNTNISGTQLTCAEAQQMQEQGCYNFCLNITPNGCDCFGCCELPAGSGQYVWLGSENPTGTGSCNIANINDPTKCKLCTPVAACMNTCAHCEVCIGKPDLPPDCTMTVPDGGTDAGMDGGTTTQCAPGVQPCGLPGQDPCPSGYYCVTGCCKSLTGG